MNRYKVEVNINLWKDIIVDAENIDAAQDKVFEMRDNGAIMFNDTDHSPDGMMLGETTLLKGVEPYTVDSLTSSQMEYFKMHIAHEVPIEKLNAQFIHDIMWKLFENGDSEHFNSLLNDKEYLHACIAQFI
jgi:hypothetical protein